MFAACDRLLIVGSSFPYIEYYPNPAQVRSVQIDIDATRIGLRYPVDAGVVGDAAAALRSWRSASLRSRTEVFSRRRSSGKPSGTARSTRAPTGRDSR